MAQEFDDFSRAISVEERYDERTYERIACDSCGERVQVTQMHYLNSFDYPEKEWKFCPRCFGKLLNGK